MATIRLLYFAWVRARLGRSAEEFERADDVVTIRDLTGYLAARGGAYHEIFADPNGLRAARDQVFAEFDDAIGAAREIAFFPPVTGG